MLRAVGGKKQQFGERHRRVFDFKDQLADSLSEQSAARFARCQDIKTAPCQSVGKQTKLRGFAASV
jgi:hypothetical protein